MKYIYTNDKGEKIESPLERWAWGVVYKPTEKQIEEARARTDTTLKDLIAERNQTLLKMRKAKASKSAIEETTEVYRYKLQECCAPEQDELKQFGDDGVFHRFVEIEKEGRDKEVDIFSMYRTDDPELLKRIDIEVKPGMKLFHFYRNIVLDYQNEKKIRKVQVFVFGWKNTIAGTTTYHYILPDDRVVTSNEDIDVLKYNI